MIVSFTGAQSTGKTTLINELSCLLQSADWTIVPEVTRLVKRQFDVDINELGGDDTQALIITQHLINSLSHKDNVIMDRCIIDGLVYTNYLYSEGKVSTDIVCYAEYMFNKLLPKLGLVFYTSPEDIPLEDDGERSTTTSFRDAIISEFEDILFYIDKQYEGPEVIRLEGSVEERLDIITTSLNKLTNLNIETTLK